MLAFVMTTERDHDSYREYLDLLEVSRVKLEYCSGKIDAMPDRTPAHADLAASAIRILGNALLGRCRVSSSDLKVRIEATDLTTFPDVSVVCGVRQTSPLDPHAVTNPTLLVEVTRPSTEDHGEKLSHYKQIEGLAAVLIVSHRRREITIHERTAEGWAERIARSDEHAALPSPSLSLSVNELYDGIALEA